MDEKINPNGAGLPPAIPLRKFQALVKFENGQAAQINVGALDHIGAMIQLCAAICNTPVRALEWQVKDVTGAVIETPPGFIRGGRG